MADALDEEWWLTEENEESSKVENEAPQPNGKEPQKISKKKKTEKRKADAIESDGKEKKVKKSNKKSKSGKDHHKERKRITNESEEELAKPGGTEDVRTMMSKVLQGRVGDEALEDLLPSDADFHAHNTEALEPCEYLAKIIPNKRALFKKSLFMKKTGSPSILIVTMSAIRAVELNRLIKDFLDERCKVAKLFAKHMKIEEQKKFLEKTNCQVGIGTPGRLHVLIKQGILQLESVEAVVLDWNWRDVKLKRLPDMPEVRQDLVKLMKDFVMEAVRGSTARLALL